MNATLLRSSCFALFLLLSFSAKTQCLYTLEMLDSYGDGWNGGILTINSGGNSASYTLNNITDNGTDSTLTFTVLDGAPLLITYVAGSFAGEVSLNITDNAGTLILSSNGPSTGTLYSGVGDCVACAPPLNLAVENVWDNRARIRWQSNNAGTSNPISWKVIYGPQGFSPSAGDGDTLVVAIPKVTITGLQKKTWYDAYVQQYCDTTGGYSSLSGPISFQTYWTNDLGIAGVVAPVSGCDLGMDSLKVILKNYGAAPQSLFTYRYAVNGAPASVVPPADGFYTGILGKDSSVVIAFETITDFSAPGEYRIDVYTELSGDEDLQNDTFTYYLNNRLQPDYVQQFEVWDGGWTTGGQNSSWEFGAPDKPSIPAAASGLNAWVTNLTGPYNPSELSYLESPCFDFSELDEDPAIEFSYITNLQGQYDGAWLEITFDGGQNWEKIGGMGEGLNWYNEENVFYGLEEVWSGNSGGWKTARHSLPDAAGEGEVRLRFRMATAPFFSQGGFGVDDIHIFEPFIKDLAGLSVSTLGETDECGLENDQILFTFSNFGSQTQSGIKVAYSINGAAPVIQNITASLATDKSISHLFLVPFDSRDQSFEIKCWTILTGDQALSNDTVTYSISHLPNPVPFQENFESYTNPPTDWTYDPLFGFSVTNTHNNISKVLAFNLYSGNTSFTADMPRFGIIQQGDSLRFTYRITNYASQGQTPTILQLGSKIEVQISTDCGSTYENLYIINSFTHSPAVGMKAIKLDLSAYAGQAIKVRFKGTWGASDFWFDLDNINMLSCPADMNLSAEITPATPGVSDGEAIVNVGLGNPPYSYLWSNGNTDQTGTDLAAGTYTVTVLDAFGCSDEISFNLGTSATEDLDGFASLILYPNPTPGNTTLQASFGRSVEANVEILNPLGQRIWYISANATDQLHQTFDLSSFPAGLYLVRISAEGKTVTRKLIKE